MQVILTPHPYTPPARFDSVYIFIIEDAAFCGFQRLLSIADLVPIWSLFFHNCLLCRLIRLKTVRHLFFTARHSNTHSIV